MTLLNHRVLDRAMKKIIDYLRAHRDFASALLVLGVCIPLGGAVADTLMDVKGDWGLKILNACVFSLPLMMILDPMLHKYLNRK